MSRPITLCGPRGAVLEGPDTNSGYTFYLDHASWWRLEGFTVQGGQKGVVTDNSDHDRIAGLYVHGTGDEAIHLRSFSSHNVVSGNLIRDTGLHTPLYGEGIYIGSANSNWCTYTHCKPDASNDDTLTGNVISSTTAENIDIKEGTTGGTISGNQLNGTAMSATAATALINVKGNGWTVSGNTATKTIDDAFQVHQVYPGWGLGNKFRGNTMTVTGSGFGIYVQSKSLRTVVACTNKIEGGAKLSNLPCSGRS
jgi:hypothetical protein